MMENSFNEIELLENEDYAEMKIDGIKIKKLSSYAIKRDTDIVEISLKISVPAKNFITKC